MADFTSGALLSTKPIIPSLVPIETPQAEAGRVFTKEKKKAEVLAQKKKVSAYDMAKMLKEADKQGVDKKEIVMGLINKGYEISTEYTGEDMQKEQSVPIKNFLGGAISEFTDIGRKVTSYLDKPAEMIARGLSSDQGQVTKNIQAVKEREKTPIGARLTGGDPESLAYKSGEFGADIAMTAVTPQVLTQGLTKLPVVAKALQVSPKLTKIGLGGVQGLEAATQYSAISEQRLPTAEELAFGGGFGSVFSALPMVPELVSNNIVKPVQKYFGKKAEELAVRGLVNVNDAKVIVKTLKETGEGDVGTLGRRGLSRKIAGNNTEDAVAKLENISKTNYDGVRKEVTTVSNKLGSMGVDDVVDNAMTMVGKNVEAINTKAGYTAVDNSEILAIQNAARNGTITLEQKQRSKELIDKFVNIYKRSGDVADTQIADVADELRKTIKNGIEDTVDIATNGKVNIREMNREVAVAEAFKKGIETKAVANEIRQYVMQGIQGSIAGGVSNQGDFSTLEGWLKFLGGAFLGRQFGKMMSDPKYVGKLAKVVDYLSAGTRESILNYIKNPKVVKLTENQLSELLNVRNAIKSITKGTQDDLLSNIQNAGDNIPMRTTPVPSSPSSFPIVPVKKATPITPTGVVQEATPTAPVPTVQTKTPIVEKGRATHNPYAPKVEPVKTPVPIAPKPNNTLVDLQRSTLHTEVTKPLSKAEARTGNFETQFGKIEDIVFDRGREKLVIAGKQYLPSEVKIFERKPVADFDNILKEKVPVKTKEESYITETAKQEGQKASMLKQISDDMVDPAKLSPTELSEYNKLLATSIQKRGTEGADALEQMYNKFGKDVYGKTTPVKQEVVQSTTAPKKQSVVPKPQEKQAVLEGKKEGKSRADIQKEIDISKEKARVGNNIDIESRMGLRDGDYKIYKKYAEERNNMSDMQRFTIENNGGEIGSSRALKKMKDQIKREMDDKNTPAVYEFRLSDKKSPVPTPKAPVSKELQPLYEEARKFGEFQDIDVMSKNEVFSKFETDNMKQKLLSGVTRSTAEKISMLDTQLRQYGHKGVKNTDFGSMYKLEDIYKNDDFFKKYPSLKDVNVVFVDFHTPSKYGVAVGNDIYINSKLYLKDKNKLRSTIVHEIQHMKQDIRGITRRDSEADTRILGDRYKTDPREIDAKRKQQQYIDSIK